MPTTSVPAQVEEEWIPGTVHFVDIDKSLDVQHNGDSDLVLIPQPSEDPNDPLKWSSLKKNLQFLLLWFWAFLTAVATNWSGPAWTDWTVDFNTTYTILNNTSAVGWCFLGVGCLILQPTAMKFGRRGVYIFATLCQLFGNVIGGVSHSVGELYGCNIMTCFAGAPCDSLVQISITDVFFQHERAHRISMMTFALYSGSYLGPIAAGYVVESQGWRWCFWYLVIFFGVILGLQIPFMQDTTFVRHDIKGEEENIMTQIISKEDGINVAEKKGEKVNVTDVESATNIPLKRTCLQSLRVIESQYNDKRPWYVIFLRPCMALGLPAFVWGGFVYGVQVMWLSLMATTQSEFFAYPPYNFGAAAVGDTNFSCLIGTFFGTFWGGTLSDKFAAWMSRRNSGIFEPEFRLWFILLPAVLNSAGLLMYGLGLNAGIHWIFPGGFGMAFMGFGMGSAGALTITYALDCYPDMQSEGLVLMLFLRNMIGMGFTFAIQPWLDRDGMVTTTWLMFMLSMVFNFSFLIFVKWGKCFRRSTKNWYLKYSDPKVLF
ncbi:DEKNAAC104370 [Brettanomyces naardenensis]|uniref:DEKNAAC104370 n=1 Tax=Brettanomyces naardenensis TaxID=13370 RepID=A0A448YQU9_BRENA|nr:DEKNAAC104370 [Brettanomyces naardenensis]